MVLYCFCGCFLSRRHASSGQAAVVYERPFGVEIPIIVEAHYPPSSYAEFECLWFAVFLCLGWL